MTCVILLYVFLREIERVSFWFLKLCYLIPNSKPITVGTIYGPPNQSIFLKLLNKNMNKIDSVSKEIYFLGNS